MSLVDFHSLMKAWDTSSRRSNNGGRRVYIKVNLSIFDKTKVLGGFGFCWVKGSRVKGDEKCIFFSQFCYHLIGEKQDAKLVL